MGTLNRILSEMKLKGISQVELCERLKIKKQAVTNWKSGHTQSYMKYLPRIAEILDVSVDYLLGKSESKETATARFVQPDITEETVSFPVTGEVAAGYNHIADEDWTGETVEIPKSYLHGRPATDYFVLTVCGDSMYPLYMDGDKVLILKQDTLEHSGQIGVIRYDGDNASLKKIEYADGEDWLRMVPINPVYKPVEIRGADLELCSVIGIPKLLIRKI